MVLSIATAFAQLPNPKTVYVVTGDHVNVRTGPGTNYPNTTWQGQGSGNRKVQVSTGEYLIGGTERNGFIKVDSYDVYQFFSGWISSQYVRKVPMCNNCSGRGFIDNTCPKCHGRKPLNCVCWGTGYQKCSSCNGYGGKDSFASVAAQINDVTVEHNQMRDGVKSMVIHVKFDIQNALGHECAALAYYFYEDGSDVVDTNGKYKAADGQCTAREDFKPGYERTTYNDLEVVMPNAEIESSGSGVSLKFKLQIYDFTIGEFVEEESYWFEFEK